MSVSGISSGSQVALQGLQSALAAQNDAAQGLLESIASGGDPVADVIELSQAQVQAQASIQVARIAQKAQRSVLDLLA